MSTKPITPNLEFQKLNSIISLYTPPTSSQTNTTSKDPTTIIFCSWMGVPPKSKYLNSFYTHYHTLFPSARILTISSLSSFFTTTPNSTRTKLFEPIVDAIDSEPVGKEERKILVHVLSNGGALSWMDVCTEYKRRTGRVLDVKALVMDSAPGDSDLKRGFTAMSTGFPKNYLWYPIAAFTLLLLGSLAIAKSVFGMRTLVDVAREAMNDWELVDRSARRLYVYSTKDEIVGFETVEEHAREAEEAGVEVRRLREEETGHVVHMLKDGVRYWNAVGELWAGME